MFSQRTFSQHTFSQRSVKILAAVLLTGLTASPALSWPDVGMSAEVRQAEMAYQASRGLGNPLEEIKALQNEIEMVYGHRFYPYAWIEQGLLEVEAGLWSEAQKTFAEARSIAETSNTASPETEARLAYAQARLFVYQNRLPQAGQLLKQALKLDARMAQAKALQARLAALSKRPLGVCDKAFPHLQKLSDLQLAACIKQAADGDPNLNMLIHLLGESRKPAYIATIRPLIESAAHRPAALAALGRLLNWQQALQLSPYLRELQGARALLALLRPVQSQIGDTIRVPLGNQLIKEIQDSRLDPATRLVMIELLGVLRHAPARALYARLLELAEQLSEGTGGGFLKHPQGDANGDSEFAGDYARFINAAVTQAQGQLKASP